MEEVWKDYVSLHPCPITITPAAGSGALYSNHQQRSPASPPQASFSSPLQPSTPPPPTALSLTSTLEFTYLGGTGAGAGGSSTSGDDPRDLMVFSTFAPADQYRYQTMDMKQSSSSAAAAADSKRQRRMIKNRESAARSRARRQAYTNELELELAQLRRENDMLIKSHQELNVRLAMSSLSAQVPAHYSSTLQRCRSAPPSTSRQAS